MHYANGRAAKVGDLVRGKGYNLKHEFTGLLLSANPNATACNCTVATVSALPDNTKSRFHGSQVFGSVHPNQDGSAWEPSSSSNVPIVHPYIEYGQLDAFLAIDPDTGEVLPPES